MTQTKRDLRFSSDSVGRFKNLLKFTLTATFLPSKVPRKTEVPKHPFPRNSSVVNSILPTRTKPWLKILFHENIMTIISIIITRKSIVPCKNSFEFIIFDILSPSDPGVRLLGDLAWRRSFWRARWRLSFARLKRICRCMWESSALAYHGLLPITIKTLFLNEFC